MANFTVVQGITPKYKKGYSFLRLLLTGVFALSVVVVFSQSPHLTLEDIFLQGKYYAPSGPDIQFVDGEDAYITEKGDSLNVYDYSGEYFRTLMTREIFVSATGKEDRFDGYTLLPGDLLLLSAGKEGIYRYSEKARYYVYDYRNQQMHTLSQGEKIMYPTLSPDGKMIAYVKDNNIFLYNLANRTTRQVTTDGVGNAIINGLSDWVYEEEFDLLSAMTWTSDSRHLSFLRFDERQVSEYTYDEYRGSTYPEQHTFKYPKTGEKNAVVSWQVYDLLSGEMVQIPLSDSAEYVPRLYTFSDPNLVFTLQLDRQQRHLRLIAFDLATSATTVWYEERDSQYLELPVFLNVASDGALILTSEKGGYLSLYRSDEDRTRWQPVSDTTSDLVEVYGSDGSDRWYFLGKTRQGVATELYRVTPDGKKEILGSGGTQEAVYSPDYKTVFITRSEIDKPFTSALLDVNTRKEGQVLTASPALQQTIDRLGQTVEFFTIVANGQHLNAWILKPAGFSAKKKYPVLLTVYGGPGSQNVVDEWERSTGMWYRYMVQQGFIVVSVDGRGTPGRGAAFRKCIYGKLGQLDTEDILASARHLASLPYVDSRRMAIYGWSYGGYMSLMCLLQGGSTFKAGVAVAPVTHWKFYDNIYAERYMGMLADNKINYEKYAPVNLAAGLESDLLLVHGTSDDNVHFQNSMEMVRALNYAGKTYDFLPYPNRNHSIYGGNTRYHLYSQITRFLIEKLE